MEQLFELLNKKNTEKEESILFKLKDNNKDYSSYEQFSSDLNNLLNIFVSDEELDDYIVMDEYSENKSNYLFTVTKLLEVNTYIVFLSISNQNNIYSNILRKKFNDKNKAKDYFNELVSLIKENNVKDLSLILINKLTKK